MGYKHSGKIELLGLVLMVLFGTATAAVLGVLYAYLTNFIPFPYINFFITLGYGGAVGLATGFGGKLGKVRNIPIMLAGGALAGLIAVYTAWVGYFFVSVGSRELLLDPIALFGFAKLVAALGPWSIFGITPKGDLLYILWVIEAVMIIGSSAAGAAVIVSNSLFCERCHAWFKGKHIISSLEPLKNLDYLIEQFQEDNFTAIYRLKKSTGSVYTEIEVRHCHLCKQEFYLTVRLVGVVTDSKGKQEKKEAELVRHIAISALVYNNLQKLEK